MLEEAQGKNKPPPPPRPTHSCTIPRSHSNQNKRRVARFPVPSSHAHAHRDTQTQTQTQTRHPARTRRNTLEVVQQWQAHSGGRGPAGVATGHPLRQGHGAGTWVPSVKQGGAQTGHPHRGGGGMEGTASKAGQGLQPRTHDRGGRHRHPTGLHSGQVHVRVLHKKRGGGGERWQPKFCMGDDATVAVTAAGTRGCIENCLDNIECRRDTTTARGRQPRRNKGHSSLSSTLEKAKQLNKDAHSEPAKLRHGPLKSMLPCRQRPGLPRGRLQTATPRAPGHATGLRAARRKWTAGGPGRRSPPCMPRQTGGAPAARTNRSDGRTRGVPPRLRPHPQGPRCPRPRGPS
jgi:hypothetical protein